MFLYETFRYLVQTQSFEAAICVKKDHCTASATQIDGMVCRRENCYGGDVVE